MRLLSGPLTDRQQDICDLVVLGKSSKEIARKLNVSHRTVESHRYRIYKKMEVKNGFELISKVVLGFES